MNVEHMLNVDVTVLRPSVSPFGKETVRQVHDVKLTEQRQVPVD